MSVGSTEPATSGGVGSADAGAGRERRRRLGRRRERTLTARLGVAAVWLYRLTFGALFPTTCKYHPSCSQYAIDAVRAKGLVRGSLLAAWRVLRCNPWSHGGFDPVR